MPVISKVLLVIGICLIVYFVLKSGNNYWRPRIEKWAEIENFKVITFRGAKFYEGPNKWLRSENQTVFRVKVRDKDRKIKQGWLVFGKNWDPISRPDEFIKVEWD